MGTRHLIRLVACAVLVGVVGRAGAAPFYEPFDYTNGVPLSGNVNSSTGSPLTWNYVGTGAAGVADPVIGAGNLGLALADYPGFRTEGFSIVALFDTERAKIGQKSKTGVRILNIDDLLKVAKKETIDIAVVAVPAEAAQAVVNEAVAAGIKAILNFSPGTLRTPPEVKLKHVDLTVSLESLSFFLAREEHQHD